MPTSKLDSVAAPANEASSDEPVRVLVSDGDDGGEIFIVENSDSEWKGLKYLQDWIEIARDRDDRLRHKLPPPAPI